ncbi:hypothetical protein J7E49_22490 [Variovorax paradoxus]|nr:hypothetical protein [Variovorax paradoxus]
MAKLRTAGIGILDLKDYLSTASDFSFEMRVLKALRQKRLSCEHGGHYEDPVTGKSREFDIRARFHSGSGYVRLAVECKNVREHFPLLVSSVRRIPAEAFHDFILLKEPKIGVGGQVLHPRAQRLRALNSDLYPRGVGVVKSTVQVGRSTEGKEPSLITNDAEIYDKWGQALASAQDLVIAAALEGTEDQSGLPSFAAVVPMVVVPNGRLWEVTYDDDGEQLGDPVQVERASCYVAKDYRLSSASTEILSISHLEIVTFDGLLRFVDQFVLDFEGGLFDDHAISKARRTGVI